MQSATRDLRDFFRLGRGTPEAAELAPIGTAWLDVTNGQGYIKRSGNLTNTGWNRLGLLPAAGLATGGVLFGDSNGDIAQDAANLFWDDTNNRLGIGTNAPNNPLHVVGGGRFTTGLSVGSGATTTVTNGVISLRGTLTGGIEVFDGTNYNQLKLLATAHQFFTGSGASVGQNIIFNSTGIGIGLGITPSHPLSVTNAAAQIQFGTAPDQGGFLVSTTAAQSFLTAGGVWNGTNWIAKATSAALVGLDTGAISFYTNTGLVAGNAFTPSFRAQITATGLGINATPSYALHVVKASGYGDVARFMSGASDIQIQHTADSDGYARIRTATNHSLVLGTNATDRVWVTASGLGIGVAASYPLHIEANNANVAAAFVQSNGSGYGIHIKPGADTNYALNINNAANTVQRHILYGSGAAYLSQGAGLFYLGQSTYGERRYALTIANNGTFDITWSTSLLIISDTGTGKNGLFWTTGGNNVVQIISDPYAYFSAAAGTAGRINVYGTGSSFRIQNLTGATVNLYVIHKNG